MSDNVYLVHKSGERYGPFEIHKNHLGVNVVSLDETFSLAEPWLKYFGMRVEPVEPEQVTITREQWENHMSKMGGLKMHWCGIVEASKHEVTPADRIKMGTDYNDT